MSIRVGIALRPVRVLALLGVALAVISAQSTSLPARAADANVTAAWEQTLWHPALGNPIGALEDYTAIVEKLLLPYPDDWGGAFVDGPVLVLNSVTYPVSEARGILDQLGVSRRVVVRRSAVSMRMLQEISARVAANPLLSKNAVIVGPQYSRSRVAVGLLTHSDHDLQALAEIGGSDVVGYLASEQILSASRYYDTNPYYGGAFIATGTSSGVAYACTSGFAWDMWDGSQYMVTASHCVTSATAYFPLISVKNAGTGYTSIGNVMWRSGDMGGTISGRRGDLAVYKLNSVSASSPYVYKGVYNTTSALHVVGSTWLPENWSGTNLLTSGAGGYMGNGDGEINPMFISRVDQTAHYSNSNQTYTNLTIAEGSECVQPGDSGGAFYLNYGTGASAVGIASGTDNFTGGGGVCRNFYTPIRFVAQDYGGAIKS